MSQNFQRVLLRNSALAYESFQSVRIASKNRIRDIVRRKIEGIEFNQTEDKKEKKSFKKKYTDEELKKLWALAYKQGKITKEENDFLVLQWETAEETKALETTYKKVMLQLLKKDPIYIQFLSKIKGIGEILSSGLIKSFGNCEGEVWDVSDKKNPILLAKESDKEFEFYFKQAKQDRKKYKVRGYVTVSKLWAHTGHSVVGGITVRRRKGQTTSYSPELKTFTWKISDSLMKGNKGMYRRIYDEEKARQLTKIYPKGYLKDHYNNYKGEDQHLTKGHAHARSLRKVRKVLLDHYWHFVRQLSGLPAKKNYVDGVLNHDHIMTWQDALAEENTYTPKLAPKKKKAKAKDTHSEGKQPQPTEA